MLPHRPQRARVHDVAGRARAYAGSVWYVVCGVRCGDYRMPSVPCRHERKRGQKTRTRLPCGEYAHEERARTLETGETRGFSKGIVDADTPHILGCANFGLE